MKVQFWIAAAVAVGVLSPGAARAEHDHGGHAMGPPSAAVESRFGAGVGLVAASYDTTLYLGDYQGVVPAISWSRGRLGASATMGVYRLFENGATRYGVGDVVVSGQATLVAARRGVFGVALPVSIPTGDHLTGFGMGHAMVMPALWGQASVHRVQLGASAGYARALGGGAAHHDHGTWPLIDPMNLQELTWSASAYVPLGTAIHAGVRMSGGIPIGTGTNRVAGGIRAIWTEGRVDTGFEIQAGIAGDPFTLRGLLESVVHF